jgi:pyruvate kinase
MVSRVRDAARETGRHCRILFDLGGPKLRTGPVAPASPVLHVKVKRDAEGCLTVPARIILDASGQPGRPAIETRLGQRAAARLSVEQEWLGTLAPGDTIALRDLRKRKRSFTVEERLSDTEWLVSTTAGAYIAPGMALLRSAGVHKGRKGRKTVTGAFLAPPQEIRLFKGDLLLLTRELRPGTSRSPYWRPPLAFWR